MNLFNKDNLLSVFTLDNTNKWTAKKVEFKPSKLGKDVIEYDSVYESN